MTSTSHPLTLLAADGWLLFAARSARLFAYGLVSVILVLYLEELGLSSARIGALLMLTLLGDTAISFWLTISADRIGRRLTLIAGALLMIFAGVLFALTRDFYWLLLAATIGIISPSGSEVGPFLAIEQAALTQIVALTHRTSIFAWYNLAGSFATAAGSLAAGFLTGILAGRGVPPADRYRVVVFVYAGIGAVLIALFVCVSRAVEVSGVPQRGWFGIGRSRRTVFKLSALFGLDSFGGGLVMQSSMAAWFHHRFGVENEWLGGIFFGANILAGISALSAGRLAQRFGLINTMVFTHIPSNVLLMLMPLMPTLPLAIGVLLLRFSISQMDVPTRQSYVMAVVDPDERSAAAGITGIARTTGASFSPVIAETLMSNAALANAPFFLAGGCKILYDLLLYREFRATEPEKVD